MADRQAINDVFADYAWANDSKDEGILKRIFAEDASSRSRSPASRRHRPVRGSRCDRGVHLPDRQGPDRSAAPRNRQHTLRRGRPDSANVRAYLLLNVIDGGALDVKSAGVYDVDFARDGDAWVIKRMHLALDAPF